MPAFVFRSAPHSPMSAAAALTVDAGLSDRAAVRLLFSSRIAVALERSGGNVSRAAKLLAIHRNTLIRRLAELQLSPLPRQIRQSLRSQAEFAFRKLSRSESSSERRIAS